MTPARYHPAARRELTEAVEYGEGVRAGRGVRLERAVAHVLARVQRLPRSAPLWPELDAACEVRRATVHRHPYLVVYLVRADQLVILAIAHTRKSPGYWASRVHDALPVTSRRTRRSR